MAVSEYKPSSCGYSYYKLENVVYLVSKEHTKKVYIDNGEAYISGLTEVPLRFDCFNLQFTEESNLDERYKFTKQVTFSLHGYATNNVFSGKYYVILKSKDGTKWMVNVDFPSKVTYTFNLNSNQYQTDFTFASVSNFPTLRLATELNEGVSPCKQLKTYGIESLRMLETDYCRLNTSAKTVYTFDNKQFVDVKYLGDSCTLTESFDGNNVTTTISFNIAFNAYKSSWHYNLLEFLQNHYAAIIRPKGVDNTFFCGFNFGLIPSFNVSTTSQNGQSDIITVTLTESSSHGSTSANEWSEDEDTETRWINVKQVGDIVAYDCVSMGVAMYLLKQEVNRNGVPTGRYKCLEGYESRFPTLNIIGTFSNTQTFSNSDCTGSSCSVITDIPISITYRSMSCYTYSYSAACDWNVNGLASYMMVTPSSGAAGTSYTLSVCNTKVPTTNESSTFRIKAGTNIKIVNVNLTTESDIINPSSVNINCLQQNVTFTFNGGCPVTVTSIDARLTYNIANSQMVVNVPRNNSTANAITWTITVKDCHNNTATVTIIQDKTYENWVDISGFICDGSTSYKRQQRYTGTTSTSINTPTSEFRKGAKIQDDDSRCGSSQSRWVTSQYYYCVDGDKWSFQEEEISYDGENWTPNGVTRLLEMVESSSSFCNESVEYKWVLTEKWVCDGEQPQPTPPPHPTPTPPTGDYKYFLSYSDGTVNSGACDTNYTLSSGDTQPTAFTASNMVYAAVQCVTTLDDGVFANCSGLTSVVLTDGLTTINPYAFQNCENLTDVTIPDTVTSIGSRAFYSCKNLTSVDLPSGLTTMTDYMLYRCQSLSSITIPTSVTTIGNGVFGNCYSLYRNAKMTFHEGITSIGERCFYNGNMAEVELPSTITSIGGSCFIYCHYLAKLTVKATTPPTLGNGVLEQTNYNLQIYVPTASVNAYKTASGWSDYADRIQAIP